MSAAGFRSAAYHDGRAHREHWSAVGPVGRQRFSCEGRCDHSPTAVTASTRQDRAVDHSPPPAPRRSKKRTTRPGTSHASIAEESAVCCSCTTASPATLRSSEQPPPASPAGHRDVRGEVEGEFGVADPGARWDRGASAGSSATVPGQVPDGGHLGAGIGGRDADDGQAALPGESRAAKLVCDLAHHLLMLNVWIKDTDREIREMFRLDERAEVINSLPRMAPSSGPSSSPSLEICPTTQTPAAQTAMMRPGLSRDHYLKRSAEGLIHTQALLALARRRVDVLWAMLRDKRHFTPTPPPATGPAVRSVASSFITRRMRAPSVPAVILGWRAVNPSWLVLRVPREM